MTRSINLKKHIEIYEKSIKPLEDDLLKARYEIMKYIEQHNNDNTAYKHILSESRKKFDEGFDLLREALFTYISDKKESYKAIIVNVKMPAEGLDRDW